MTLWKIISFFSPDYMNSSDPSLLKHIHLLYFYKIFMPWLSLFYDDWLKKMDNQTLNNGIMNLLSDTHCDTCKFELEQKQVKQNKMIYLKKCFYLSQPVFDTWVVALQLLYFGYFFTFYQWTIPIIHTNIFFCFGIIGLWQKLLAWIHSMIPILRQP